MFEKLWDGQQRAECERLLFGMLEQWGLARPCDTAEMDKGVPLSDVLGEGTRTLDTMTMHDKKMYAERYVFPLSLFLDAKYFKNLQALAKKMNQPVRAEPFPHQT